MVHTPDAPCRGIALPTLHLARRALPCPMPSCTARSPHHPTAHRARIGVGYCGPISCCSRPPTSYGCSTPTLPACAQARRRSRSAPLRETGSLDRPVRVAYRDVSAAGSQEFPATIVLVHGSPGDNSEVAEAAALLAPTLPHYRPRSPGLRRLDPGCARLFEPRPRPIHPPTARQPADAGGASGGLQHGRRRGPAGSHGTRAGAGALAHACCRRSAPRSTSCWAIIT